MTTNQAHIFDDIEKNEYLNELYKSILFNYSLALLDMKIAPKAFSIADALQFADTLSMSTHPENSENHKILAQEMVALLYYLFPSNSEVANALSTVLSNLGNYRGMKLKDIVFQGGTFLDCAYDRFSRDFVAIPANPNEYFFRSQKIAYDNLSASAFSYSGPTSMGKSYIIRMLIKKQVLDGIKQNFAIIVPTKALINEVSRKLIKDDLRDNLGLFNYKVVKFADQLSIKKDGNFIFVLTPERLLYLLISEPELVIDFLFIDEAHKISSKDKRSAFYYKVIGMFSDRRKPHFIFASPNIPNPEVYYKLLPESVVHGDNALASSYSPVSQIKYIIDLPDSSISFYNPLSKSFPVIKNISKDADDLSIIHRIGSGKQNLIYVSATEDAVNKARYYAQTYATTSFSKELILSIREKYNATPTELLVALSKDIKSEVHKDCFLAETILKGVAYHIGYLPASIRMRIEELYEDGIITTLFCTSTLIEGVNLSADNLFITSYWNGGSHLTQVEFRNLVGRVGRIRYNLYGNVFLLRLSEKEGCKKPRNKREKFEELLTSEVLPQELSIVKALEPKHKMYIVDCLANGNISLIIDDNDKLPEGYDLMRKFAQILLKDILKDRRSFVRSEFEDFLDEATIAKIKEAFKSSIDKIDDDINTSVDQAESLREAITDKVNPLTYPTLNADGSIDYDELLTFLKKLLVIFKWDKYESATLGKTCKNFKAHKACRQTNQCYYCKKQGEIHKQLGWYAVILSQWFQSKGISQIIDSSMDDKKKKGGRVGYGKDTVPYDYNNQTHRNMVISETLKAIEQVLLFSLANYFLKFSNAYKAHMKKISFKNDWYEFVEYGTTNELVIYFQRNGFSREVALYIDKSNFVVDRHSETPRLKRSIADCTNANVKKEVADQLFNAPNLFVD